MPSAGFEPTTPATKRPQTYAILDCRLKICHDTKEIDTSIVKQNKYGLQPKYVAYFTFLLSIKPELQVCLCC
jgi:hypothetical protein